MIFFNYYSGQIKYKHEFKFEITYFKLPSITKRIYLYLNTKSENITFSIFNQAFTCIETEASFATRNFRKRSRVIFSSLYIRFLKQKYRLYKWDIFSSVHFRVYLSHVYKLHFTGKHDKLTALMLTFKLKLCCYSDI